MSQPLTNLGLYGDFSICDKDIISGLNANFQLLDNLVQLAFNAIVPTLPPSPVEGDKYILPDGTINLWNGSAWITYPAQEGYIGFNKDDGLLYFFDGTNWAVYTPPISVSASVVSFVPTVEITSSNVQDAIEDVQNNLDNISASDVSLTPSGSISSTNVQDGIDEIVSAIDIAYSDISDLNDDVSALTPSQGTVSSGVISFNDTVVLSSISANQAYTFTNQSNGKSLSMVVINTSGSTVTISFPAGVCKRSDMPLTIDGGKRSVYTFIICNSVVYIACVDNMEI